MGARHDSAVRSELIQALMANNELYRIGAITREQWTATNRELAAKGEPHGMILPRLALEDR